MNKRVRGQRLRFRLENEGCHGAPGCAYGRWHQVDKLDSSGQPSRLKIGSLHLATKDGVWHLLEGGKVPFHQGFQMGSVLAQHGAGRQGEAGVRRESQSMKGKRENNKRKTGKERKYERVEIKMV